MFGAITSAVKVCASLGASALTINGLAKLVPANAGRFAKAMYMIGAVGLAGAAGDASERYFDRQFKAVAAGVDAAKEVLKEEWDDEDPEEDNIVDVEVSSDD